MRKSWMDNSDFQFPFAFGAIVQTNQRVGDLAKGHQLIVLRPLDSTRNPLILCESRGKKACVHLHEIEIVSDKTFQV